MGGKLTVELKGGDDTLFTLKNIVSSNFDVIKDFVNSKPEALAKYKQLTGQDDFANNCGDLMEVIEEAHDDGNEELIE